MNIRIVHAYIRRALTVSCGWPRSVRAELLDAPVQILPRSGSIPLGQNCTFACTSNDTFLNWFVTLPGQSPLSLPSNTMNILNLLKKNGVFYNASRASVLHINGNKENNGTKIECVTIRDMLTSSDSLFIAVYGKLCVHVMHKMSSAFRALYPHTNTWHII